MDKGVVAALDQYGRGTDIRFNVDCTVVVGFTPTRMEEVRQIAAS